MCNVRTIHKEAHDRGFKIDNACHYENLVSVSGSWKERGKHIIIAILEVFTVVFGQGEMLGPRRW